MKTPAKALIAMAALAGMISGCASHPPKQECKSCHMGKPLDKGGCGTKAGCSSKNGCRANGNCSTKGS